MTDDPLQRALEAAFGGFWRFAIFTVALILGLLAYTYMSEEEEP